MYPTDGTNPYVRMEALDIEMKINSHYLGRDDQVSFENARCCFFFVGFFVVGCGGWYTRYSLC